MNSAEATLVGAILSPIFGGVSGWIVARWESQKQIDLRFVEHRQKTWKSLEDLLRYMAHRPNNLSYELILELAKESEYELFLFDEEAREYINEIRKNASKIITIKSILESGTEEDCRGINVQEVQRLQFWALTQLENQRESPIAKYLVFDGTRWYTQILKVMSEAWQRTKFD